MCNPVPALTGSARSPLAHTGSGYGLTGLAERAALLGGTLRAGLVATVWTVELWLPM